MSSFTVLFTTKSVNLTLPSDVRINLHSKFNRKCLPQTFQQELETIWEKRLKDLPSLFNGTKFRLDSVEENNNALILNLGVTCYKDFQATNLSENMLVLQSQGLCDHESSQAYMSDALGVGALIQTNDNHMVLLYRSNNCGEDKHMWDRPGGHAEPKSIVGSTLMEDINVESMSPEAVKHEILNCIIEEIVSEVNIPAEVLGPPGILGIHRSNVNGGKPNIEFLVRCNLTAAEIESLYKQGNQIEAYESEQILLLPIEKALEAHISDLTLWNKMATGAKAVLTLYNMYKHRFLLV